MLERPGRGFVLAFGYVGFFRARCFKSAAIRLLLTPFPAGGADSSAASSRTSPLTYRTGASLQWQSHSHSFSEGGGTSGGSGAGGNGDGLGLGDGESDGEGLGDGDGLSLSDGDALGLGDESGIFVPLSKTILRCNHRLLTLIPRPARPAIKPDEGVQPEEQHRSCILLRDRLGHVTTSQETALATLFVGVMVGCLGPGQGHSAPTTEATAIMPDPVRKGIPWWCGGRWRRREGYAV